MTVVEELEAGYIIVYSGYLVVFLIPRNYNILLRDLRGAVACRCLYSGPA